MANPYETLTKAELINLLINRDTQKKLGLIWERDEIEHDQTLNKDFVTLELDEALSVGQEPYHNLLVEGDNFDALRNLKIAYKGRVKCIYIDPPYNTGNKDFIYNDKFVDRDHAYRHSMWLEFMYRRLDLAKDLLAENGVIFVSIGEEEYAHLSLLMDQVFPGMHVGTFVWRRRSGANDEKEWFISADHEYVLCFAKKGFSFAGEVKNLSVYTNPDNDPRGDWNNDNLVQGKNYKQRPETFYPLNNPETDIWYAPDADNVWRFSTETRVEKGKKIRTQTMEALIADNRVLWPAEATTAHYVTKHALMQALEAGTAPHNLRVYLDIDELRAQVARGECRQRVVDCIPPIEFWLGKNIGYGKPRYKRFKAELKRTEKPVSTWILPSALKKNELESIELEEVEALTVGYTSEGTSLLSQMVGNKDFGFPKPMSLIKALVNQSTGPDANHIVMDFFAGSGTTAHAVMELNAEDGGDRRFIMVSSTEATRVEPEKNVCRDIARKRLNAAINGYSYRDRKGIHEVSGLGGDLAYFKTVRTAMEDLYIEVRHDQIWYTLQQIHADGISRFEAEEAFQVREANNSRLMYIFEPNQDALGQLDELLASSSKPSILYAWRPAPIKQQLLYEHLTVERIPEFLLERFGQGVA